MQLKSLITRGVRFHYGLRKAINKNRSLRTKLGQKYEVRNFFFSFHSCDFKKQSFENGVGRKKTNLDGFWSFSKTFFFVTRFPKNTNSVSTKQFFENNFFSLKQNIINNFFFIRTQLSTFFFALLFEKSSNVRIFLFEKNRTDKMSETQKKFSMNFFSTNRIRPPSLICQN